MNDIVKFGKYKGKTFHFVKINDSDDSYKHYLTNNLKKIKLNNKSNAEALLQFLNKNSNFLNLKKYFEMPVITSKNSDIFECPICFDVCAQLKQTRCGHTFCSNCLFNSLKNNPICPICRTIVNYKSIMNIPIILKNIINDMVCECPYKNNGCTQTPLYKNLIEHSKSCQYNNSFDLFIYQFINTINIDKPLKILYKEFKKLLIDNNINNTLCQKQFIELLQDSGFYIYSNKIGKIFSDDDLMYSDIIQILDMFDIHQY